MRWGGVKRSAFEQILTLWLISVKTIDPKMVAREQIARFERALGS